MRPLLLSFRFMITVVMVSAVSVLGQADSPRKALQALMKAGQKGDEAKARSRYSRDSLAALTRYQELAAKLSATSLPENPSRVFMAQLRDLRPKIITEKVVNDQASVIIRYANGLTAALPFVREGGQWKFNLAHELAPAIAHMEKSLALLESYRKARDEGRPPKP
ncbi:MAG: hypothetical protein HYR55_01670 [Acidobacteria bacterium]|nr:hypothetical protein [Acidobacteriota bacterium]MBI3658739.1 hypothetical protein [Acidobacteriota bacterium]